MVCTVLSCSDDSVEDKDIHDVSNASPADVAPYEILLLGCSTWGAGDLQDDWDSYLGKLKKLDLSEKTVALFGCGDSASFSDTFCDAIGYDLFRPAKYRLQIHWAL